MHLPNKLPQKIANEASAFPALARLGLSAEDMQALAQQGFMGAEQWGGHTRFKLRFRRAGRQVVRYIRSSEEADKVRSELYVLQRERRRRRELADLNRETSHLLRESKKSVQPLVEAYGFKFHGRQVRRPRRPLGESHR